MPDSYLNEFSSPMKRMKSFFVNKHTSFFLLIVWIDVLGRHYALSFDSFVFDFIVDDTSLVLRFSFSFDFNKACLVSKRFGRLPYLINKFSFFIYECSLLIFYILDLFKDFSPLIISLDFPNWALWGDFVCKVLASVLRS